MDLNLYYKYVSVLAFYNKLKYGNARSIKNHDLNEYFSKYMNNFIQFELSNGKAVAVINNGEDEELDDAFPEMFYYNGENDSYCLYPNISIDELNDTMNELIKLIRNKSIFYIENDSIDMLKTIKATATIEAISSLIGFEKENEKAYYDYLDKPSDEKSLNLKKRFLLRAVNNINFSNLPSYTIDALFSNSIEYVYDQKPYSIYPMHRDVLSNLSDEDRMSVIDAFEDVYLDGIFGKNKLATEKVSNDLSYVMDKDSSDYKRGINYFYLRYLNNIDKYNSNHERNESLNNSRKRLLYAIDDETLCLFINGNLDSKMIEAEVVPNDYDYCSNIKILMKPLLMDLFMFNNSALVAQKLLLMKTYYEVTHDEEFEYDFASYKSHPYYSKYHSEVFGLSKTLKL